MTQTRAVLFACSVALASGCSTAETEPPTSPYPGVAVAGTIRDVRGTPVEGAHVVVWNAFDSGSANTAADGTFSITVDGSDSASHFEVTHSGHRPRQGTVSVGAAGAAMGDVAAVSKEEILVQSLTDDIWLVRADGAYPATKLTETGASERTPRFSRDGLTVRWAKVGTDEIEEAAWNGTGVHVVRGAETGYLLQGIDWAERGTIAWRTRDSDGANGITILETPSGGAGGFGYTWTGIDAAASPPAFGWFGPQPIEGNMIAFDGGDGIYTAFPYFDNSFFVPEKVAATMSGDGRPAWSPFRTDATLHLGLLRNYKVFVSEVTAGTHANVYSTPAEVYGNVETSGSEEPDVLDFDWAPETVGQPDRIALVVHFFSSQPAGVAWGRGDVLVVEVNPATGQVVGGPTVVYDASGGTWGSASRVAWR